MQPASFFHGGVPGKQSGDRIVPAAHIGLDYSTAYAWAPGAQPQIPRYRPDLVYSPPISASRAGTPPAT